jgi:hypothetical protein
MILEIHRIFRKKKLEEKLLISVNHLHVNNQHAINPMAPN